MPKDHQKPEYNKTTSQKTKLANQPQKLTKTQESIELLLQRTQEMPLSLTPRDIQRLQRNVGNQALSRLDQNKQIPAEKTHMADSSTSNSLQRMLANQSGKKDSPTSDMAHTSTQNQNQIIQRYLMNKSVYPYVVVGPDDMDDAQEDKVKNTLLFKDEIIRHDIDAQLNFSKQTVANASMENKRKDTDHIYVYDKNTETKKRELQATHEVSDIRNTYNVKTACVLQALINVGAVTNFDTAKDLHDDLWENFSPYRLYDLDDVYPQLYQDKGLTRHDAGSERLDKLVEDTLEVGKKYVLTAAGLVGGNGHNFCIKVKTVGSGNKQHKDYDLIEDPNNPGSVLDDTKIAEYWSL